MRLRNVKYPSGESPAEKMERLGVQLADMADDVRALAQQLKEEEDERRRAWLEAESEGTARDRRSNGESSGGV